MPDLLSLNGRAVGQVLFDLDGTLADTAGDLAAALNHVLRCEGCTELPFDQIRPHVSHGGVAMLSHAFSIPADHSSMPGYRKLLLDYYQENLSCQSRLFPGMEEVLEMLESRSIPWGVVTNKPGWLTDPLMTALDLDRRAATIVSGDTTAHSKPHPLPIQHACAETGIAAAQTLYIGDAQRDIEAGQRAGTLTSVALYGYLGNADDPRSWGADHLLERPAQLLELGAALP